MTRLYIKANVIPDPAKEALKKERKFNQIHFIKPVSVEKLYGLKDLVVLDFRQEDAFTKGSIKLAKSMPFASNDVKMVISELDKEVTYLIYHDNDEELKTLSEIFSAYEFKNVYVLDGGYEGWLKFQNGQEKSLQLKKVNPEKM
jgi:rhodanese-related sulfurtransferase